MAPSPATVKLEPVPVAQIVPSLLYCHEAPLSKPLTLTTPLLVLPSELDEPESEESAIAGADGFTVSNTKLVVAALLVTPALVAVALTLIVPFVRVVKSALVRETACAAPVPVSVFVTERVPLVKVIDSVTPLVPVMVITPLACVASEEVAPSLTPVPRARTGVEGPDETPVALNPIRVPPLPSEVEVTE